LSAHFPQKGQVIIVHSTQTAAALLTLPIVYDCFHSFLTSLVVGALS
jgi:hypothetical protein